MNMMNVTVVIPTCNGGLLWKESARRLAEQMPSPFRIKVIDSSSSDDTRETAQFFYFEVEQIGQKDFDHGGTRSYSLADIDTEFVVFLTQDALLEEKDTIANLISVFDREFEVVCAYGRQLPHVEANPLSQYARYNNYPNESYITSLTDHYPDGFRKAFFSNSFAAYRLSFLKNIGGFPEKLILGEDSFVAAKALVLGKSVAYVAEAEVRHSHNYSVLEEFKRYFDIGVFHTTQPWILEEFGNVEGDGLKFVLDQVKFLCKSGQFFWVIPSLIVSIAKLIGYKLGKQHKKFPHRFCRKLSMHKNYWNSGY